LGGLWHGAQWTFVAWGGLHGLFLAFERATKIRPGVLPTFVAVTLAWVLFRAQSFPQALEVYHALFAGGAGASMIAGWCAVLTFAILAFAVARLALQKYALRWTWQRLGQVAQSGAIAAMLLGVELLSWSGAPATFIYFKF